MELLSWKTSSKQSPTSGVEDNLGMSFTVFLGNLPAWVTADDIRGWLSAENLVADAIKVIRNPETQESKGFAFIESPNTDEMNAIIRRFDRAPLEDRLLRANPAQPPKPKGAPRMGPAGTDRGSSSGYGSTGYGSVGHGSMAHGSMGQGSTGHSATGQGSASRGPAGQVPSGQGSASQGSAPLAEHAGQAVSTAAAAEQRPPRRGKRGGKRAGNGSPNSAFAEELAKAL
jgi:RNA recognition motif-containing protein